MSGWIGVDLDGTLAEHYWSKPDGSPYDELLIGKPVPKMVARIHAWLAEGWEVRVFTARVGPHGSAPGFVENIEPIADAIRAWTKEHIGVVLEPTATKDYHMIELWDDRAVRVVMDTGDPCCYEGRELRR
jgi:hypothetical protein